MKFLKEDYYTQLISRVSLNTDDYMNDEVWIDSLFPSIKETLEKEKIKKPVELVKPEGKENLKDYENTVLLHSALPGMSLDVAADRRVWSYLTHVTYWDYMRARWPIENAQGNLENFIKTRYFYGQKARIRNGISRLWWMGHITYDESLDDSYELTKIMLKGKERQDLSRLIMETNTLSRNKKAIKVILRVLETLEKDKEFNTRHFIRYATKYVNYTGSVTLWDSLKQEDMEKIIFDMSDEWRRKQQVSV